MSLFIKDVIDELERLIPLSLQEEWDNSGYQIKLTDEPVSGIVTSLDITDKCANIALKKGYNLILTHHPLFFHPLHLLDLDSKDGKVLNILVKNGICVYSMHTNFDSSQYSMSRYISGKLGVKEISPLRSHKRKLYKLSVFIPKGYVKRIRDVLFAYANPRIGNYENCSFETKGRGSFKPLSEASPFIGAKGETSFVSESKLEVIIEKGAISNALDALKKIHPYEEVAFDLYPLYDFGGSFSEGMGAMGNLEPKLNFKNILNKIYGLFTPLFMHYCGKLNRVVKRIAVVSGSGFLFIDEAIKNNCDVLISSELTHSKAIKANKNGICLVELSHFDMEKYFALLVRDILIKKFSVPVIENNNENNPFFNYKGGEI
ncbi:MAG: Nif3-like dinuclear metal center hexameric protein [Deltaproteobacteria bacterium]|nr:Nif3-like dinuclear metal center hexameric protein [Deltaproteobacteria bacterium]